MYYKIKRLCLFQLKISHLTNIFEFGRPRSFGELTYYLVTVNASSVELSKYSKNVFLFLPLPLVILLIPFLLFYVFTIPPFPPFPHHFHFSPLCVRLYNISIYILKWNKKNWAKCLMFGRKSMEALPVRWFMPWSQVDQHNLLIIESMVRDLTILSPMQIICMRFLKPKQGLLWWTFSVANNWPT